jgi:3D (Asp-Asp-Asp) domain-containing protein
MKKIAYLILIAGILYNIILQSKEKTTTNPVDKFVCFTMDKLMDNFIKKCIVEKTVKVRLTTYWAKGGETDKDSANKRSYTGATLKEGVSVAVDPRLIPFFKRLYIPNLGVRVAHDTGTAVKCKKASGGKLPVIDVFFEKKKDAMLFAYNNPKIVTVSVYKY